MKNWLLICVAVLALAVGVPASAQFMFIDTNLDGECNTDDAISDLTTSVDIWLATDLNGSFFPVSCPAGQDPTGNGLTINSYTFILRSTGGITFGTWVDAMGFGTNLGSGAAGNDRWIGRGSGNISPPGVYLLGTQNITATGTPVLSIVPSTLATAQALTSFGSACTGIAGNNTMKLGVDWTDVCGTTGPTSVNDTTWGKIKALYRGN